MFSIFFGLVAIGVLVLVHELGHFLVARAFGIGAPVFAVGMGPRLFGFRWRGTDVRVCALPIGGYVQLAGADPFGEEDADSGVPSEEDFSRRPVWQKLLVMAAGPGVNLVLPVFLFGALIMMGRPETGNEIGEVVPDSVVAELGWQAGDRLVEVQGREVGVWREALDALASARGAGAPVAVTLERGGERWRSELGVDALDAAASPLGVELPLLGALPYRWSARVGVSDPASPAHRSGVRTGDWIVAVSGEEVEDWRELQRALREAESPTLTVEREDDRGEIVQQTLTLPPLHEVEGRVVQGLDDPWGMAPIAAFIADVSEDMPAAEAGLRPGDRLLTLQGRRVWSFSDFNAVVTRLHEGSSTPVPLEVTVERQGEPLTFELIPRMVVLAGEPYRRPVIGIRSYGAVARGLEPVRRAVGPLVALPMAIEETGELMHATLALLGNLFVGEAKVSESLGGPVAIVQVAGQTAERGVFSFVTLLGMLSISIGLINLLPVPVLDGGQILFHLVEAVRGRPLSLEVREKVQIAGIMLLVLTFLYVTANDIHRWVSAT